VLAHISIVASVAVVCYAIAVIRSTWQLGASPADGLATFFLIAGGLISALVGVVLVLISLEQRPVRRSILMIVVHVSTIPLILLRLLQMTFVS
jgi:hypothetical protein